MASYILVLGNRTGIMWILQHHLMAFPRPRPGRQARLDRNDELWLYSSRQCWGNPARDRGRIFGHAKVTSTIRALPDPIQIGDREYTSVCDLKIGRLAEFRTGIELYSLVDRMNAFPRPEAWSSYIRRTLLKISAGDAQLLERETAPTLISYKHAIETYPGGSVSTFRGRGLERDALVR